MNDKGMGLILDVIFSMVIAIFFFTAIIGLRFTGSDTSDTSFTRLHYISEDAMDVLNKKGLLDDILELYNLANGNISSDEYIQAQNLTKIYLDELVPGNTGYMLVIEDETLYGNARGTDPRKAFVKTHSKRLLSGYGPGEPIRGHSARAFLTDIKGKETSKFVFYGGFTGQGNITSFVRGIPADANVRRACFELNTPANFIAYVNDYASGLFVPSGSSMAASIKDSAGCIDSTDLVHFTGGDNKIDLKFITDNISLKYVGGGYLKVTYNTSSMGDNETDNTGRYYFPGIKGMINLYDSLYVPGILRELDVRLHYYSKYPMFLNIGEIEAYNSIGNFSDIDITIPSTELQALGIIYDPDMSEETIPIRMSVYNVSEIIGEGKADVILATDLSGSMNSGSRLNDAKDADIEFIEAILNSSSNQVGLVSYGNGPVEATAETINRFNNCCTNENFQHKCTNWICQPYFPHASFNDTTYINPDRYDQTRSNGRSDSRIDLSLTDQNTSLTNTINSYSAMGGTCIACGINAGIQSLILDGRVDSTWSLVIMTDGKATMAPLDPDPLDTYSIDAYMPQDYDHHDDYSNTGFIAAREAARQAYDEYGIRVYTVGFGSSVKQDDLIDIAQAGNGTYYFADNKADLINVFTNISTQIFNISREAQTFLYPGTAEDTILYPDSYIQYTYTPTTEKKYGEISITRTTDRFNDVITCNGTVNVLNASKLSEFKVTSYSDNHWTDNVVITNSMGSDEVYQLWDITDNYTKVGDPYTIQIPVEKIAVGEDNIITIETGDNETTRTGCSSDNMAIYTQQLKGLVGYGNVYSIGQGCEWNIEFNDGSITTFNIPEYYNGTETCNYTESQTTTTYDDALNDAVYRLLKSIDIEDDSKVDVLFESDMLEIKQTSAGGVRSLWGPLKIKLVVWN